MKMETKIDIKELELKYYRKCEAIGMALLGVCLGCVIGSLVTYLYLI